MNILGFECPPREVAKESVCEGVVDRIGSYTHMSDFTWTIFVLTLVGGAKVYEFPNQALRSLALTRQGDKVSFLVREVRSFEGDLLRATCSNFKNESISEAAHCAATCN